MVMCRLCTTTAQSEVGIYLHCLHISPHPVAFDGRKPFNFERMPALSRTSVSI